MVSTVDAKSGGPKVAYGGSRLRWIALGTGLAAVQFLSALTLGRIHDALYYSPAVVAFWPSATAVVLCAVAVFSTRGNGPRKAAATWWATGMLVVAGFVGVLEFSGAWQDLAGTVLGMGMEFRWQYYSYFGLFELVMISLLASLGAAAWLALRGRGPYSHLGLIPVVPMVAGLLNANITYPLDNILAVVFNVSMISYVGPFSSVIWMVMIIVPVVAAAWLATLPPITRADQARETRRRERKVLPASAPPPPPGQAGWAPAGPATNGMAITSMVLGLVGLSLPAIVLGHIARSQIAQTGEQGAGMAMAGLVLGYLGMVAVIAVWGFIFMLPAILGA